MDIVRFSADEFDRFVNVTSEAIKETPTISFDFGLPEFRLEIHHMAHKINGATIDNVWLEFSWNEETQELTVMHELFWFRCHVENDGNGWITEWDVRREGLDDKVHDVLFDKDNNMTDLAVMYVNDFLRVQLYLARCIPNAYRIKQKSTKLSDSPILGVSTQEKKNVRCLVSVHEIGYIKKEYIRPPEHMLYSTYQCECWGVRGHVRHLKSGKEVFIRAYEKGKKRNQIEPKQKEYKMIDNRKIITEDI